MMIKPKFELELNCKSFMPASCAVVMVSSDRHMNTRQSTQKGFYGTCHCKGACFAMPGTVRVSTVSS